MWGGEFHSLRLATGQIGHLDVRADSLTLWKTSGHGTNSLLRQAAHNPGVIRGPTPGSLWTASGRREINVLALHINEANVGVTALVAAIMQGWRGSFKTCVKGAKKVGKRHKFVTAYLHNLTQGAGPQGAIEGNFNWNKCLSCLSLLKSMFFFVCYLFFIIKHTIQSEQRIQRLTKYKQIQR